ncbi:MULTISPECIES: YdhK family protein [Bhargavaea]|uniref:YdhK family protein n=1 Tax=Bhargavaea changchunensis TaxID=2134037 RepID=A0ABW2NIV1_9BACL|nr:YdhK family protein [Bhargavaea sp. CC-171006]
MNLLKWKTAVAAGTLVLLLAGCQSDDTEPKEDAAQQTEQTDKNTEQPAQEESSENDGSQDSHAMHSSSGEVPEGLKEAENPTFRVGSTAMMHADHMPGMNGVEATISGAFETTAYSVTYTPTDGGEPVKDHKWVVHEELENPGEAPLEPGTEVTLLADHMPGMKGATATVDSAEQTTVYMVDFIPSDSNEEVKNHKWVTEEELSEE